MGKTKCAHQTDAQGKSETDEIVFQAGGMFHHSAMFRIIKGGILANGQLVSDSTQVPHHYEYYKIDSNLGAGCYTPIDEKINTLKNVLQPIQIPIQSEHTRLWIDTFKRCLNITTSGPISGLEVITTTQSGQNIIVNNTAPASWLNGFPVTVGSS